MIQFDYVSQWILLVVNIDLDKLQRRLKLRMAAIPLVIITLDLVVTPLVVSTIMKGKPFQFQFQFPE